MNSNTHTLPILLLAALAAAAAGAEDEITCATCHEDPAFEIEVSVHHATKCQTCHGGKESYSLEEAEGAGMAFDHGDSFQGAPDRAQVPQLCGQCHTDVELMNPYGLRTDVLARYWSSGHGRALRESGDTRVAVCIDCHGTHEILNARDARSRTHPTRVPDTCATCHADADMMAEYGHSAAVVDEYRRSVHGQMLLEHGDTGAPTCATCHGNHAAAPPGFANVGAVCGQCHQHAQNAFSKSIHARQETFHGCVQCHGGGPDRHFHLIERITKPPGVMIQRYEHLIEFDPVPTGEQVTEALNASPKQIMRRVLPTCLDCHDELDEDESLAKMFTLLDDITASELAYVETGRRLNKIGQGVLLVDRQRFVFEQAKTHLIELAPELHTLDNEVVDETRQQLKETCDQVNAELDELQRGLAWRYRALIPVWLFAALFATALYVKYRELKSRHVRPLGGGASAETGT